MCIWLMREEIIITLCNDKSSINLLIVNKLDSISCPLLYCITKCNVRNLFSGNDNLAVIITVEDSVVV